MMLKTHFLFGVLVALIFSDLFSQNRLLFFSVVVIASVLPDIDIVSSYIGKRLEPFARVASLLKHRGFFHSITIVVLLYLLLNLISREIALAASLGYLSHLFLDSFTKKGVPVFYPLKFRIKGFTKTGSFAEYIILFFIMVATLWYGTSHL